MRRWLAVLLLAPLVGVAAAVVAAGATTDAGTPPRPVPAPVFPSTQPRTTLAPTTTTPVVPVSVHTPQVEHYEITGRTARELRRSMEAKGLIDTHDNTLGDAMTTWNISWSWQRTRSFDPRAIEVVAATKVTLPRWTPPQGADPNLVRRWQRYLVSLTKHEDQHVAIVVRCATSIPAAVAATASYQEADAIAQAILEQCDREGVDFDKRTDHGAKDGVIF